MGLSFRVGDEVEDTVWLGRAESVDPHRMKAAGNDLLSRRPFCTNKK